MHVMLPLFVFTTEAVGNDAGYAEAWASYENVDYKSKRGYGDGDGYEEDGVAWEEEGEWAGEGEGEGEGEQAPVQCYGEQAWNEQYGAEAAEEEEEIGAFANTPSGALHLWKRVAIVSWLTSAWRGSAAGAYNRMIMI